MKIHAALAATLVLALAACNPPVADYTDAEAPKALKLNDASHDLIVRFLAGSDRLAHGEAERLRRLVANGEIGASDRVSVSPAGPPALAKRRVERIASEMLRYGMTVGTVSLATVPRDTAIVEIGRALVTLPPCPNWSSTAVPADFTNMRKSNFGEMVASPTDLANGQPLGLAAGGPAAAAVNRYKADKVVLPAASSALPIAAPQTNAPGAGNSPGS
ncbi:MAG TPA: CpaD family pilus assembly lipoprotein [Stellaceae bacterium]|nr:CpaD family pilus assembly lipoprotein [Stellaceae bacterium]